VASDQEMEMHKAMLLATAVAAGALALPYAAAQDVAHPPAEKEGTDSQQVQQKGSGEEGTQVTGMVTAVDPQTQKITIEDQTFVMPKEGGGAALFPQVGSEVTLSYKEEGGQKVITRIGQKQQ
jgi:hypothetical protein